VININGAAKMLCNSVYNALKNVEKKAQIDADSEAFLREKGLITVLDPETYRKHLSKSKQNPEELKSKIKDEEKSIEDLETKVTEKKEEMCRTKYKIKSVFGLANPKKDKMKIKDDIDMIDASKKKISDLQKMVSSSKDSKDTIAGYIAAKSGNYVKLTEQGKETKEDIRARNYRFADLEFDLFNTEIKDLVSELNKKIVSWKSTYDALSKEGYHTGEKLMLLAVDISNMSGTKAIGRFNEIYKSLMKNVDDSDSILSIAAMLCKLPGEPEEIAKILMNTYKKIYDDTGDNNKHRIAAAILMGPGKEGLEERIESYKKVKEEFFNITGWDKDNDYLPAIASLAMLPGDYKEHTSRIKQTYDILSKEFVDGTNLRIASMILASMRTDNEKAIDEFKRANSEFEKLTHRKKCREVYHLDDSCYYEYYYTDYITPAIMTIMPGDPEEAVNILEKTVNHLEKNWQGPCLDWDVTVNLSAKMLDGIFAYIAEHSESFKSSVNYWNSSSTYHPRVLRHFLNMPTSDDNDGYYGIPESQYSTSKSSSTPQHSASESQRSASESHFLKENILSTTSTNPITNPAYSFMPGNLFHGY
jgi:predicted  nucleic acid-binding Zn-ribbon protein